MFNGQQAKTSSACPEHKKGTPNTISKFGNMTANLNLITGNQILYT